MKTFPSGLCIGGEVDEIRVLNTSLTIRSGHEALFAVFAPVLEVVVVPKAVWDFVKR